MNKIIMLFIAMFFIFSCSSFDKTPAEEVMNKYFDAYKNDNFEIILNLYSEDFYKATSKDEWESMLKNIKKKLGNIESYKLAGWNLKNFVGISGSGIYYNFTYQVKYKKYSAKETITLFKPKNKDEIKIRGHNIQSEGFLKE